MKNLKDQLITEGWECRIKIDNQDEFDILDEVIKLVEDDADLCDKYGEKKIDSFISHLKLAAQYPIKK